MANPQLETFLAKAKADPELLQRLLACANLDGIAALGSELGHQFSGIDLVRHQAEATLRLGEEGGELWLGAAARQALQQDGAAAVGARRRRRAPAAARLLLLGRRSGWYALRAASICSLRSSALW